MLKLIYIFGHVVKVVAIAVTASRRKFDNIVSNCV